LAFAWDSAVGFTGFVAVAAGICADVLAGAASGVLSCGLLPLESVGVNANRITAESSRNDFNITASSKSDAENRHPFELMDFWHEL
jgi:hypothetical protein